MFLLIFLKMVNKTTFDDLMRFGGYVLIFDTDSLTFFSLTCFTIECFVVLRL